MTQDNEPEVIAATDESPDDEGQKQDGPVDGLAEILHEIRSAERGRVTITFGKIAGIYGLEDEMTRVRPAGDVPEEPGRTEKPAAMEDTEEKTLSPEQQEILIGTLKTRFEEHPKRHKNIQWTDVEEALRARADLLWSLQKLEETEGKPDVFMQEEDYFVFGDCSAETPTKRRNIVYDDDAQKELLQLSPDACFDGNAEAIAKKWKTKLMNKPQYRHLQTVGKFDDGVSWSWVDTPPETRKLGVAFIGLYDDHDGEVHFMVKPATYFSEYLSCRCVVEVPKVRETGDGEELLK